MNYICSRRFNKNKVAEKFYCVQCNIYFILALNNEHLFPTSFSNPADFFSHNTGNS